MSVDHRQTAAGWHGGGSSRLYNYASTGAVLPGLDAEIEACLANVERGQLDTGLDPVDEHARLTALLHEVEPQLATQRACEVGREHGQSAAAWWQQDAIGGRATGDTRARAEQVLQGIEDGDPAILDWAPGWAQVASLEQIMVESDWPEPSPDDRAAHKRWDEALPDLCTAYSGAFVEAYWDAVAEACRNELAGHEDAANEPGRLRSDVGAEERQPPSSSDRDLASTRQALARIDHSVSGFEVGPVAEARGLGL